MKLQKRHPLNEAAQQSGLPVEVLVQFIELEWIHPVDQQHQILDEEDLARACLIWQLQQDFGVNHEAIPIILHLVDQLNCIHIEAKINPDNPNKAD